MRGSLSLRLNEGGAVRVGEYLLLGERAVVRFCFAEDAHEVAEERHFDEACHPRDLGAIRMNRG